MPGSGVPLRKLSVDSPTLRSALDVGESHFASVEKFFELYGLQTLGDGDFQQVVERLAENNGKDKPGNSGGLFSIPSKGKIDKNGNQPPDELKAPANPLSEAEKAVWDKVLENLTAAEKNQMNALLDSGWKIVFRNMNDSYYVDPYINTIYIDYRHWTGTAWGVEEKAQKIRDALKDPLVAKNMTAVSVGHTDDAHESMKSAAQKSGGRIHVAGIGCGDSKKTDPKDINQMLDNKTNKDPGIISTVWMFRKSIVSMRLRRQLCLSLQYLTDKFVRLSH